MSFAFGEPPDSGVKVSANPGGAAISKPTRVARSAAKSRRRGMPVGKARASYSRLPGMLHFVAPAPNSPEATHLGDLLRVVHPPGRRSEPKALRGPRR